jgi:hypothetical protein
MGWARMELETEITDYKPTSCCKPVAPPLIIRQAREKLEADLTKLKQLVEEESLAGLTRHRTPSSYGNIIRA